MKWLLSNKNKEIELESMNKLLTGTVLLYLPLAALTGLQNSVILDSNWLAKRGKSQTLATWIPGLTG